MLTFSVNHQIIILLLLRKKPLSEGVGPIYAAKNRFVFAVKIVIIVLLLLLVRKKLFSEGGPYIGCQEHVDVPSKSSDNNLFVVAQKALFLKVGPII